MDAKYTDVHDGRFHHEITRKFKEARDISNMARELEVESRSPDYGKWEQAFDTWRGILDIEEYFDDLLLDESVVRMTKKTRKQRVLNTLLQLGVWLLTLILSVVYVEQIRSVWYAFVNFICWWD